MKQQYQNQWPVQPQIPPGYQLVPVEQRPKKKAPKKGKRKGNQPAPQFRILEPWVLVAAVVIALLAYIGLPVLFR